MIDYWSMSVAQLLQEFNKILIAKRKDILWTALDFNNMAAGNNPNDLEKPSVRAAGSDQGAALEQVQRHIDLVEKLLDTMGFRPKPE